MVVKLPRCQLLLLIFFKKKNSHNTVINLKLMSLNIKLDLKSNSVWTNLDPDPKSPTEANSNGRHLRLNTGLLFRRSTVSQL